MIYYSYIRELTEDNVLAYIKEQGGSVATIFDDNILNGIKSKGFRIINNTFREFSGTYIKYGKPVIEAPDGEIIPLDRPADYTGLSNLDEMMEFLRTFRDLQDMFSDLKCMSDNLLKE